MLDTNLVLVVGYASTENTNGDRETADFSLYGSTNMVGYRSTYARAHRSPPSHALVASGYSRATSPYTPILSRYPLSTSLHPFSLAATAAEVQLALARVPPIKARTLLFFHRAHNFPQQILRNGNRKHPRLIRYASKLSAYG